MENKNNIALIVAVGVLSFLLLIAVGYILIQRQLLDLTTKMVERNNMVPTVSVPTEMPTETPTIAPPVTTPVKTGDISFLDKPVKVELDIFSKATRTATGMEERIITKKENYYVGNFNDGAKLVVSYVYTDGMGGETPEIFKLKETKEGKYLLIPYYINQYSTAENKAKEYPSSVYSYFDKNKVDISSGRYPELDNRETIESSIGKLKVLGWSDPGLSEVANLTRVSDPKNIIYVKTKDYAEIPGIYTRQIFGQMNDFTVTNYNLDLPFYKEGAYSPNVIWNDGTTSKNSFTTALVSMCGTGILGDYMISGKSSLVEKVQVAGKVEGVDVYKITDPENLLVKKLYDNYKQTAPTPVMTVTEYAKKNSHFLYKEATGDYIIFINQEYGMMAECGKPVIYLYPTKISRVKVEVGAKVTVSEPKYPASGWEVVANPNGKINYKSQEYPYLFWEGKGNGPYPETSQKGVVVAQKEVGVTIKNQLEELGLNQTEIKDFWEFWEDKMPKTPYVRLTWLQTEEMNRLAPLLIEPKPETVIRVFLDFEGLEKPKKVEEQKLERKERNGFTVVEWGGLWRR